VNTLTDVVAAGCCTSVSMASFLLAFLLGPAFAGLPGFLGFRMAAAQSVAAAAG